MNGVNNIQNINKINSIGNSLTESKMQNTSRPELN